jgi:hypothetical protein
VLGQIQTAAQIAACVYRDRAAVTLPADELREILLNQEPYRYLPGETRWVCARYLDNKDFDYDLKKMLDQLYAFA